MRLGCSPAPSPSIPPPPAAPAPASPRQPNQPTPAAAPRCPPPGRSSSPERSNHLRWALLGPQRTPLGARHRRQPRDWAGRQLPVPHPRFQTHTSTGRSHRLAAAPPLGGPKPGAGEVAQAVHQRTRAGKRREQGFFRSPQEFHYPCRQEAGQAAGRPVLQKVVRYHQHQSSAGPRARALPGPILRIRSRKNPDRPAQGRKNRTPPGEGRAAANAELPLAPKSKIVPYSAPRSCG